MLNIKAIPDQMNVGELIDALENVSQDKSVAFDFCGVEPLRLESYRGDYSELSIVPRGSYSDRKTSSFVLELKAACGSRFLGYKGGNYIMDRDTLLWVADCGECFGTVITGVIEENHYVILETKRADV